MDTSRVHLIRWGILLMMALMLLGFQGASAQSSGEVSGEVSDCTLVPLELPLFGGTPVAMLATPADQPAKDSTEPSQEAIQRVLEQYVACINTGDPTLVWAIFSSRWFSTTFADPEQHYLPAFEQMLDSPQMGSEYLLELAGIQSIDPLSDGRVDVTAAFRSGDREWIDTLTLVLVDGQWLVDDVTLDTPAD